jgi:hypothetical protein
MGCEGSIDGRISPRIRPRIIPIGACQGRFEEKLYKYEERMLFVCASCLILLYFAIN